MPSVLTVRSSGGAGAAILSVSRLNQAIGWSFYAVASGVSKMRRMPINRARLDWDTRTNHGEHVLPVVGSGVNVRRFDLVNQSTKPASTGPHCRRKAERRRARP